MCDTLGPLMERNLLDVFGQRERTLRKRRHVPIATEPQIS